MFCGFGAPVAVFEMLRMDGRKLAFDPRDLRQPAGMVRNAMLHWANTTPGIRPHFTADHLARFLQGHKSAVGKECSQGGHFAVVPLPSVNPPSFTADGWLRRVAVIGYGVTAPVDRELFEELTRGLHGALLEDNGKQRGELRLLTAREQQRVLAPLAGPANRWRSHHSGCPDRFHPQGACRRVVPACGRWSNRGFGQKTSKAWLPSLGRSSPPPNPPALTGCRAT